MASIYALIPSDGSLQFRDDIPGGTGRGAVFVIHRPAWGGPGLNGQGADADRPGATYPPNRVGTTLVTALEGPDQHIFGDLILSGDRIDRGNEQPVPCGLTEAQEHLIRDVHSTVYQDAHPIQG